MYIYQADVWCDECAEKIKERLDETIDPKGSDGQTYKDTDNDDSDGYPQGPYDDDDSETDCPNHCAAGEDCLNAVDGVGCMLGRLTENGVNYVLEALREPRRSDVVLLWMSHYEISWPKDLYTLHLENTDDDPTQIMIHFYGPYAREWCDDDQWIDGSSWETDGPDFAYTMLLDRPGLVEELAEEGYDLDLSSYSECGDEEFAIAAYSQRIGGDGNYRRAEAYLRKEGKLDQVVAEYKEMSK